MKHANTKKSCRASSARIIGVVAAMIVVVATVMALALTGSAAEGGTIALPEVVPNTSANDTTAYSVKIVENFDAEGHRYSSITQGAVSDDCLTINYGAAKNAQARVEYTKDYSDAEDGLVKINRGSKGIMFYVDASTAVADGTKQYNEEDIIAFELYLQEYLMIGAAHEPINQKVRATGQVGYYYDLSSETWNETTGISGGRMAVPSGFEGYIYIPFSSYVLGSTTETVADLLEENDVYAPCLRIYSDFVTVNEETTVLFDNISIVMDEINAEDRPSATNADAVAIAAGMSMHNGMNIRVGVDNAGIRFLTYVSKNETYNKYFSDGYENNVEFAFGTLLIPTSMLGVGELPSLENENVLNIRATTVDDSGDQVRYTAVLGDIPWTAYDTDITALSYIVPITGYNADGIAVYGTAVYVGIDGAANAPVVRSYMDVVNAALADDKDNADLLMIKNTPDEIPVDIETTTGITGAQLVTDFTDNFNYDKYTDRSGAGISSLIGTAAGAASGLGFKITTDSTSAGASNKTDGIKHRTSLMTLAKPVDVTGYTGLMYYVDASGMSGAAYDHDNDPSTSNRIGVAVMMRLSSNSNGSSPAEVVSRADCNIGAYDGETIRAGAAYYFEDGEWVATSPTDTFGTATKKGKGQYFMAIPENYVGWIYVPLDTYCSGTTDWATYTATNKYLATLELRTNYNTEYGSIVFDNIYLVK